MPFCVQLGKNSTKSSKQDSFAPVSRYLSRSCSCLTPHKHGFNSFESSLSRSQGTSLGRILSTWHGIEPGVSVKCLLERQHGALLDRVNGKSLQLMQEILLLLGGISGTSGCISAVCRFDIRSTMAIDSAQFQSYVSVSSNKVRQKEA
uniref:ARAD1A14608p n=1 Tax=Blastobotrys adeninivorans TaxID=409370 RepID=A0A060T3E3_BLAAD